jgi:glutathione synthase/RimK-type ligase-like ATP-grasp enzyme
VEAKLSSIEGDAFLESVYGFHGMRWVSPPHLIRFAEAKLPQLQLASRLGLRVPRTIVTNDPDEAHRFARNVGFNVAHKSLITPTVGCDDSVLGLFTRRLSRDELAQQIDSIRFAPTLLQEYVPKTAEIRVTIIGSDTFATEIDSQSVDGARIDWRQVDPFSIRHRPVSLPDSLITVLRRFVGHYGLRFGAIDLILTPDGDYVFLENNPNGQWYWLEVLAGQPMAASMARLLTEIDGAWRLQNGIEM